MPRDQSCRLSTSVARRAQTSRAPDKTGKTSAVLRIEYAERRMQYGVLFRFSLFYDYERERVNERETSRE